MYWFGVFLDVILKSLLSILSELVISELTDFRMYAWSSCHCGNLHHLNRGHLTQLPPGIRLSLHKPLALNRRP